MECKNCKNKEFSFQTIDKPYKDTKKIKRRRWIKTLLLATTIIFFFIFLQNDSKPIISILTALIIINIIYFSIIKKIKQKEPKTSIVAICKNCGTIYEIDNKIKRQD